MTRQIAVLGSTGSIGTNTLKVIDALGESFQVAALTAHQQVDLLAQQVKRYRPRVVAVTDPQYVEQLRQQLPHPEQTEILSGPQALVHITQDPDIDTVVNAVVGVAGLPCALSAAQAGKRLAIANKEPLVVAGELLINTARQHNSALLPIDSEHSAIFQALLAGKTEDVSRIILTASGGPFRQASAQELAQVTKEQALAHPTWNMGPKITVDSATMMNKALEIIEACRLFDVPVDKIDVLIHPESIIHSLVEFIDGSTVAQLGPPDMCLPIQYALTYPKRVQGISKPLRLSDIGQLNFEPANPQTFRAIPLAYQVARAGGTTPAVFNAANEAAVQAFLAERIKFVQIMDLVEHCLDKHDRKVDISLEGLLEADAWARQQVQQQLTHPPYEVKP